MQPMSWGWVGASVSGTSHFRSGTPCQDAYRIGLCEGGPAGSVLVLTCADGAGSAECSQEGSSRAVASVIQSVANFVADGHSVGAVTDDTLREWFSEAAYQLQLEADHAQRPVRDYACTLLVALTDDAGAAYAQLGDGAIIVGHHDSVAPVFWPQQGEFANTTYFITASEHLSRVQTHAGAYPPERIAVITDGLQHLALRFADRTAHPGFFSPLFAGLRAQGKGHAEVLLAPLREFLSSPLVNARTDDDKTLLLAIRDGVSLPPAGMETQKDTGRVVAGCTTHVGDLTDAMPPESADLEPDDTGPTTESGT